MIQSFILPIPIYLLDGFEQVEREPITVNTALIFLVILNP